MSVSVSSSAADGRVSGSAHPTFKKGATAYDALCATSLSVSTKSSQYGLYVSAIGGLAEFEYGGKSGWMYSVNGSAPSVSCGKYVLSELLVCGECGSPYRRVIWTQKGAKRVVWRCQNRLEHGRKICKQSPTLDEGDIHDAVISAMNELFRMQAAKDAVKAGIAAVLAGEEQTMSLPAVELQIRNLQERQLELFQLIVSAGADCTDYDDELQQVNIAKTRLMAQKAELEKEQRGAAAFESRLAELDMALEQASGTLTDFDELTVRQLVSNIKVLDKDSLLICFKDGTEITQAMQRRQTA